MGKINKDSLGNRQKRYESVSDTYLVPKMPIIIRIDGKAFHTYTKGMKKPFDELLGYAMIETTKSLCKDIHTCVFGYTQSDEITLILNTQDRIKSQEYMNRRVQKIASLAASKATKYFNKYFIEAVKKFECLNKERSSELSRAIEKYGIKSCEVDKLTREVDLDSERLYKVYTGKIGEAEFDARAFNVPEWDCINNIIWRQQDAIRNSVEAVGHTYFSAKQLNKVSCAKIKEMLKVERGINWDNDFTDYQKYGAVCSRVEREVVSNDITFVRRPWEISSFIIEDNRDYFSKITGLIEE